MPTFDMESSFDDEVEKALHEELLADYGVQYKQFEAVLHELSEASLKTLVANPRRLLSESEVRLILGVGEGLLSADETRISEAFAIFIGNEIEFVDG